MSQLFMRFPGGKERALTFSYDDGVEQDVRLTQIFKKYNMKATFNLNSGEYVPEGTTFPAGQIHRRLSESAVTALYGDDCFEVAVHGYTHPWLDYLPANMCTKELLDDRAKLEKQFNRIIRGMAYPWGTYSDEVVECMKSVGIVYSRTVGATHDFNLPQDWMRLDATCHHNDPKLMELADRFLHENSWGRPRMFYLWGHSYEFEADNNWEVIEKFCELLANRDDIWYATNIEIYDYEQAFKSLQISMDESMIHNPSAYEIFFFLKGNEYSVKPGETLRL